MLSCLHNATKCNIFPSQNHKQMWWIRCVAVSAFCGEWNACWKSSVPAATMLLYQQYNLIHLAFFSLLFFHTCTHTVRSLSHSNQHAVWMFRLNISCMASHSHHLYNGCHWRHYHFYFIQHVTIITVTSVMAVMIVMTHCAGPSVACCRVKQITHCILRDCEAQYQSEKAVRSACDPMAASQFANA